MPLFSKDFAIRSLADRVNDLEQLTTLYPNVPKSAVFPRVSRAAEGSDADVDTSYVPWGLATVIPNHHHRHDAACTCAAGDIDSKQTNTDNKQTSNSVVGARHGLNALTAAHGQRAGDGGGFLPMLDSVGDHPDGASSYISSSSPPTTIAMTSTAMTTTAAASFSRVAGVPPSLPPYLPGVEHLSIGSIGSIGGLDFDDLMRMELPTDGGKEFEGFTASGGGGGGFELMSELDACADSRQSYRFSHVHEMPELRVGRLVELDMSMSVENVPPFSDHVSSFSSRDDRHHPHPHQQQQQYLDRRGDITAITNAGLDDKASVLRELSRLGHPSSSLLTSLDLSSAAGADPSGWVECSSLPPLPPADNGWNTGYAAFPLRSQRDIF
jgi:hypothetical protein